MFHKSDLYQDYPAIPAQHIRQISARTGQSVKGWLDEVLSGDLIAGNKILDIDYEQYARAEAALAWFNLRGSVRAAVPCSPAMMLGPLLDRLDAGFTAAGISIVHLKAIDDTPAGFLKAAICASGQEPEVEGALSASPAARHDLLLNIRALGPAERVREIVEQELDRINGELTGLHIDCFHPAAPKPERRVARAG